jgi:DNA anti-recombination protein RmuC
MPKRKSEMKHVAPSNKDLQRQIDKNHAEIRESLRDINQTIGKIAPVLADHESRLKQTEKEYSGLVDKLWAVGLMAGAAFLKAALDFLSGGVSK